MKTSASMLILRMKARIISIFNTRKICKKIHTTYQSVGENDIMLSSALGVYIRLFPIIGNLPEQQQLDIVHEATMIAYDARTKAFEHMINYIPNNV